MDVKRSARLVFALMLYVLASGITLLTRAGSGLDVGSDTLAAISAVTAWAQMVLVASCVYALLLEIFQARAEAREHGEPVPRMLGGLFTVYSLALILFMYRCAVFFTRAAGWTGAATALVDPTVAMLVNVVTLIFAYVSFRYIARPKVLPRVRIAWRWLRRVKDRYR